MSKSADQQIFPQKQLCFEFWCEAYFSPGVIANLIVTIIRIVVCVFVLLLGIKMPPDFMRTVTMAIFIPVGAGEVFNFYQEVVTYLNYFQTTNEFQLSYISWNDKIQYVFYDYIHYDFMIMIIIGLYCSHLCIKDDESIFVFPVKTIVIVLQIVPLFLCLLRMVPGQENENVVVKVILIVSKFTTFICFLTITGQAIHSLYLVSKELPYDHAVCTDMQIRDARSRLSWFLVYLIIPYISLIPFFLDCIIWTIEQSSGTHAVDVLNGELVEGEVTPIMQWQIILGMLQFMVHYYRPTWLVILTCFFLPPYRRAVPLLCCCCPCCPTIQVEPLPRKTRELSNMYKNSE